MWLISKRDLKIWCKPIYPICLKQNLLNWNSLQKINVSKTCDYINCKQFNELEFVGKKKEQSLYQSKPSPLYYKYYWLHNYITVFIVTAGKATKQLSCSRYSTDIWWMQLDLKALHCLYLLFPTFPNSRRSNQACAAGAHVVLPVKTQSSASTGLQLLWFYPKEIGSGSSHTTAQSTAVRPGVNPSGLHSGPGNDGSLCVNKRLHLTRA